MVKTTRSTLLLFAVISGAGVVPNQGLAQVSGGTISGVVKDQTGAAIPNAAISLTNVHTNLETSTSTNRDGVYTVANLLPGDYSIEVNAAGFAKTISGPITLTVGAQMRVDIPMKLGGSTEQVRVQDVAPSVELATSTVEGTVNSTAIRELPLNGRDWTQLATLQPGVVVVREQQSLSTGRGQRGFGTQLSVSGTRPQQNNYRLNGISINDYANGAPGDASGLAFGVDAVQQFSVLSSNYPAEYGRSSGGVINAITRSGTDQFHGDAYEFIRNSALDARNYFDGAKIPPFRRNQFGIAAGAPIWKGHTFVFANYEALRQALGITNLDTVPSDNARMGLLSTGTITVDPSVTQYLNDFYPHANGTALGSGDTARYRIAIQQTTNEDFGVIRGDHRFSDKDSVDATYMTDRSNILQPDEFAQKYFTFAQTEQYGVIEETHIFSPGFVNTVRAGVNRLVPLISNTPSAINPLETETSLGFIPGRPVGQIQVTSLTKFTGGLGALTYYDYHYNTFQVYDDAFLTKGLHAIKFGFSSERTQLNMLASNNPNGVYAFGSLRNFLTNKPTTLTTALPGSITERGMRQEIFGAYLEDDWRVHPRLTANLGVRYEMATVPTEVQGKISRLPNPTDSYTLNRLGDPYFSNPTLKNFAPRVGLSWDPFGNGKTAVRSGFGIYDSLPLTYLVELMTIFTAPFFDNAASSALPQGAFPTGGYAHVAGNPKKLRYDYVQQNPKRNYVMQWNLNVQRNLGGNFTATVAYVGSRAVHNPLRVDDMDIVMPTLTPQGYLWPSPAGSGTRLNPNVGEINRLTWAGDSYYDAFELDAKKNMGHGFQLHGNLTWGRSIDDGSATVAGDTFANSQSSLLWFNNRINRSPSDFNIGRNAVVNGTWQVPKWNSAPSAADLIVNGWELNGIFQASDGIPFSIIIGGDPLGLLSSDITGAADVPNRLIGSGCGSLINAGNPNGYLRTQCLEFPTPSTLRGNLGRNAANGPGLETLDFSLNKTKNIPKISEQFGIQFRWELFNSLNRANFAPPLNNNQVFDQNGNPVSGAGLITSTQSTSRQMQFGLKIIW